MKDQEDQEQVQVQVQVWLTGPANPKVQGSCAQVAVVQVPLVVLPFLAAQLPACRCEVMLPVLLVPPWPPSSLAVLQAMTVAPWCWVGQTVAVPQLLVLQPLLVAVVVVVVLGLHMRLSRLHQPWPVPLFQPLPFPNHQTWEAAVVLLPLLLQLLPPCTPLPPWGLAARVAGR